MNTKILIIGIVVLAIVAIVVLYKPKQPETVTTEEEYLLEDEMETLMNEQLDQIEGELEDYNTQIEDEMSSDLSMFYYD